MSVTHSQIPIPDLHAPVLAGGGYETPISAVRARGGRHLLTLHGSWLKHAFLLLWIFNFP